MAAAAATTNKRILGMHLFCESKLVLYTPEKSSSSDNFKVPTLQNRAWGAGIKAVMMQIVVAQDKTYWVLVQGK